MGGGGGALKNCLQTKLVQGRIGNKNFATWKKADRGKLLDAKTGQKAPKNSN